MVFLYVLLEHVVVVSSPPRICIQHLPAFRRGSTEQEEETEPDVLNI